MAMTVIGYVVLATDGHGKVQHEQEFLLSEFADAKARAERHADKIGLTMGWCGVVVKIVYGVSP
jgi:hypothetical protein